MAYLRQASILVTNFGYAETDLMRIRQTNVIALRYPGDGPTRGEVEFIDMLACVNVNKRMGHTQRIGIYDDAC